MSVVDIHLLRNKKPPRGRGFVVVLQTGEASLLSTSFVHLILRRRRTNPRPIKPKPNSPSVAGSGTEVMTSKFDLPAPVWVIVTTCCKLKPPVVSTPMEFVPEKPRPLPFNVLTDEPLSNELKEILDPAEHDPPEIVLHPPLMFVVAIEEPLGVVNVKSVRVMTIVPAPRE